MENDYLSMEEIIDLIIYSIRENNEDVSEIEKYELISIYDDYLMNCDYFQNNYVVGKLDTFKKAACLMIAINRGFLSSGDEINASIAYDAALKMCEKPHCYEDGELKKLDEINFKYALRNNEDILIYTKKLLVQSLLNTNWNLVPLNYYQNLELLYYIAIKIDKLENDNVSEITDVDSCDKKIFEKSFFSKYRNS